MWAISVAHCARCVCQGCKEESEDECLTLVTERCREFQITGLIYSKCLYPRVLLPILGTRKIRAYEAERRELVGLLVHTLHVHDKRIASQCQYEQF